MSPSDAYYRAFLARDSRFDGKFFIGVKTTGIYCRPICPAKPKRENVEFFADALGAERAGYRPCLRCRPESAPSSPAWLGRSAVVQRALRLLFEEGSLAGGEERFAARLGVSARHLRRLFQQELGRTPKQIWDAERLGFARKLVAETRLPLTELAYTAGFGSLRRFNDAFKDRFKRTPSQLREARGDPTKPAFIELSLAYRPPFDWGSALGFFRDHLIEGVERVGESEYERVFSIGGKTGAFSVRDQPTRSRLSLRIATEDSRCLYAVCRGVRQMFDLDCDPELIGRALASCGFMKDLYQSSPGLRLVRGFDPFASSIGTILGQLVSVPRGRALMAELVQAYGEEFENPLRPGEKARLFPAPRVLAQARLEEVGTTGARKAAIREFSRQVAEGTLELHSAQDPAVFRAKLRTIGGIGPWSTEYICLRALGDTDAFPASDLILKRALEAYPRARPEIWRPWRGYGAIHLWKRFAGELSGFRAARALNSAK